MPGWPTIMRRLPSNSAQPGERMLRERYNLDGARAAQSFTPSR
jgi:hypothetical protein